MTCPWASLWLELAIAINPSPRLACSQYSLWPVPTLTMVLTSLPRLFQLSLSLNLYLASDRYSYIFSQSAKVVPSLLVPEFFHSSCPFKLQLHMACQCIMHATYTWSFLKPTPTTIITTAALQKTPSIESLKGKVPIQGHSFKTGRVCSFT